MSLSQLRTLRRAGYRPPIVTVIVGKPPSWFDDEPRSVVIDRPGEDLSPLFGMRVHIVDIQGDIDLTRSVLADLDTLNTTFLGGVGSYGAVGQSPEHEESMRGYWEHLCGR